MLQKKCKECLEAENIPLTNLLFYILKILDPYKYKSSHLTMKVILLRSISNFDPKKYILRPRLAIFSFLC